MRLSKASSKLFRLGPVVALVALAVPGAAFGQATRTWVSGVGDDANPCSRTAPCKTFAGAISKTAPKGEINVIDPGGFGAVTITKSITIKAEGPTAGVLTNAGNAININAAATDKVKLYGLDINGLGTALNGVRITQAKMVVIRHSQIYEFARNAISFEATNNGAKAVIADVHMHDNAGNGVLVAPGNGATGTVTIRRSDIDDNACGVTTARFGPDPAFNYGVSCGTLGSGAAVASAVANTFNSNISDNVNIGVFSQGSTAVNRIGANTVTGNSVGLNVANSGSIFSFGNNMVNGNGFNGGATAAVLPFTKRAAR